MQRQIESMMPTPKQIVENIDKKLEEKRLIMKLIDKDLLVKEIKERIKKITDMQNYNLVIVGIRGGYEDILSFLDTLEVKEVDLEKEIDEVIHNYKVNDHQHTSICSADIEWIAEHFLELGLKVQKGG